MFHSRYALGSAAGLLAVAAAGVAAPFRPQPTPNDSGTALTVTTKRRIDPESLYFQELGTNGRTCNTCHREDSGWSITPAEIHARFEATEGLDPLFRTNDGSNSPYADVSTFAARQRAYSMLLNRGVIRVGLPIPPSAEFELLSVDDPHGFASAAELSLFRRPLPASNLRFQSTIMWDGRQTTPGQSLAQNLARQALDATAGHAQATTSPTAAQLNEIVSFESSLFHAQSTDALAGSLSSGGAKGGPQNLSRVKFKFGINNPFPGSREKAFNPRAFTLFSKWNKPKGGSAAQREARMAIARGQVVFNEKRFTVTGVAGLNDDLNRPAITVTCTTCHNTPNVGTSSIGLFQDIGVSAASRRIADQPLYVLRNLVTGATRVTTDPGRALVTGKWKDIDRFKVPTLRGLAARAPYFHDGSAATLGDVVDFYDTRFNIGLSEREKSDLVRFMQAL